MTDPTQTLAELLAPIRERVERAKTDDGFAGDPDLPLVLTALDAVLAQCDHNLAMTEVPTEGQTALEARYSVAEQIRYVVHTALDGGASDDQR